MGGTSQVKSVDTKKVVYMLGAIIFGGLLLVSIIDANFYIEEYSLYTLWEFRFFTVIIGTVYYLLTYLYYRYQKKASNEKNHASNLRKIS